MARLHLLFDAPSDLGTYSGGSWETGLPLANLVNQQPTKVARSTDADEASTRFVIDHASARQFSMFALINVNLSSAATVRIRVSQNADGSSPTLDKTIAYGEANVVWGSLPWGSFPWSGFIEDEQPGGPIVFYKHPSTVAGRYVLVDISDESNAAGYVQAGRFMAGQAFVPQINMAYGAGGQFIDESRQSRSVGGQLYTDKKPKRRRFQCALNFLTEAESWGSMYDMQRKLGISGALLLVYDPEDAAAIIKRRTIYGHMTDLSPIVTENASSSPYSFSLTVEELV